MFDINKFKIECQRLADSAEAEMKQYKEVAKEKIEINDFEQANIFTHCCGEAKREWQIYSNAAKAHEKFSKQELVRYYTDMALHHANDTWSGRGNDFRRSCHEGQINALKEIFNILEHGQSWK